MSFLDSTLLHRGYAADRIVLRGAKPLRLAPGEVNA
jgi:hypothetical protein